MTQFRFIRQVRSQGKSLPPKLWRQTGKHKKAQLPRAKTSLGTRVGSIWTSLKEKNSRGTQPHGGFTFVCVLPPGTLTDLHSDYGEKNSLCFQQGEGKRDHFEMHQILLFLWRPALRRNSFILSYLEEGKYTTVMPR